MSLKLIKLNGLKRVLPQIAEDEGARCTQYQMQAIAEDLEAQAMLRLRQTINQSRQFKRCMAL